MFLMCSVLLNNWLKITVMKNGELLLADIKRDKKTSLMTESTIAIYSDELNLLTDVVNLLVKRAVFHKQITTVDELLKLTIELTGYCAGEFKKLNKERS
ncbi:DUF5405 family protein [Edwardsiella anguillarum]|uniref:DUF5405 family protein n=1 Tax=Edwardsiella anguillarum TaxID=1821960 RepID=UPI0024B78CAA|nr:DUF5405 family protein [Edwardsiella anguillarum]WHQ17734.1 DUF5405 family protein [Edwardsiella anguillarum]WHQ21271.1 DUF5405 family protein [Edwardsiella anguillarum]WHQ24795.1 DUF5405 family protein [Edwardsiella anguillarum]